MLSESSQQLIGGKCHMKFVFKLLPCFQRQIALLSKQMIIVYNPSALKHSINLRSDFSHPDQHKFNNNTV